VQTGIANQLFANTAGCRHVAWMQTCVRVCILHLNVDLNTSWVQFANRWSP